MQYALLIHETESVWDSYTDAQQGEIMAGYGTFSAVSYTHLTLPTIPLV